MTRLESRITSHSQAGVDTLFSTAALMPAPVRNPLREPFRLRAGLGDALETLLCWHERARQRRVLQQLSDHLLRDLGISRATALAEAGKPFWRG